MAALAPTASRSWLADQAVVVAPAALAAVLCAIGLTSRSLGFDEGATVAIVSQHGGALGSAIARDGGNMSGYYLAMHVLVAWFGDGLAVLRLPSLVFAVATVALVAAIGRRLFDERVAGVAGLLCAVSLPLVYWGQTARGYAPMVAWTCAGFLCFLSLADERRPGDRRAVLGYAVCMALAAYCSFVAVLVVPVQLLAVARRPGSLRRLVVGLVGVAVLCAPLAVLAVRRGSGQLFWVPRPSHRVDVQVLQSMTSAGLAPSFHPRFTTTVGVVVIALAVLGLGAVVARRRDPSAATWPMALVVTWAVLPVLLTFLYSLAFQPVFLPRNLLVSVSAVALALAAGLCLPRLPRAAALAGLLVVLVLRFVPVVAAYGVSPEPWRQATLSVLARTRPGDCIAFYPEDARNPFRYYAVRARGVVLPRAVLPDVPWSSTRPFVERYGELSPAQADALARGPCTRMWLVTSHEGQADGPAPARAHRTGWFRLRARLERAFGHARIHQFGYASPIHVEVMPGRRRG